MIRIPRIVPLSLTLALAACAGLRASSSTDDEQASGAAEAVSLAIPDDESAPPAKAAFQVVGRGPVTWTRTTGLAVFRGVDGRDYAYTGTFGLCPRCLGGRMYAWDVTDPARPVLTDSVVVDAGMVNDVAVNASGTLAVITREGAASRRNGIVVLDLADPAHPRVAADYWETLLGGAHRVTLDGTLAYVVDAGTADLAVIDLAEPADPREIGRWGLPYRPEKYLHDVAVKDGLAYLAYWDDGLVILDVGRGIKEGTPTRPRLVAQYRYRTEWRGERYGRTAHVFPHTTAGGRRYVFVGDEIIPLGADLGRPVPTGGILHVLDVDDPDSPEEVGTYAVQDAGVKGFRIANDTLYVAAFSGGVRAVDLSGDPRGNLRSREVASLVTADSAAFLRGMPWAWSVAPHAGHVFATDFNSGLWVLRLVPEGGE